MSSHRRRDRGVTVVEAAFVLPLFLVLLLAMIDLGFAEFQTSQASSAARDGARFGVLEKLDEAGIQAEVEARLVKVAGTVTTDVDCLDGLSGNTVIPCSAAVRNEDRIRVTVEWPYDAPTFVGQAAGIGTIRGSATMVIVDRPISVPVITTTTAAPTTTTTIVGATTTTVVGTTTTTAAPTTTTTVPGQCVATGILFDPAPLKLKNGSLAAHTTFTVTTNGAATCTSLDIELPVDGGPVTRDLTNTTPSAFEVYVNKNSYDWNVGDDQTFRVLNSSGQPIGTFQFDIS